MIIISLIRYSSMFVLIFLILAQNPKADGINTFGQSTHLLSNNRSTEQMLNNVTWISVIVFFLCTILLANIDA